MDQIKIKGKVNTAICYARVVEEEAIEQIRRMCEALGYRVTRLRRVRINSLRLGALKPGQWRELTPEEVAALHASIK